MSQSSTKPPATGTNGSTLVYVVDDEPMLLELAVLILKPLGLRVQTFRDAWAALQSFKKASPKPALVISDYAMHEMNGLALVEACRKLEPAQKVLLVSGTVDASVYADSPCKPDQFLAKPYEPEQFIRLVKSLLFR